MLQTEKSLGATTANAAEAEVRFCFNAPPSIIVPCNTTTEQDVNYSCRLNYSDPEGGNISYFQIPLPPDNDSLFNISDGGWINWTPTNNETGNHSVILGVDDNSGCSNAYGYYEFNYTVVNINDPPYLIRAIPAQSFATNTTLFAFYLSDYFADPDDDPLAYEFIRGTSDVEMNITITGDSQVIFSSTGCGKAHFQFTATDPGNLSANSNAIQVEVTCQDNTQTGDEEGTGGSGGGGGGGGASLCEPELVCMPWSECYPTGLQIQVCRDKNGCDDTEIKFYQNCTYLEEPLECEENWLCSAWGVCSINEIQTRTCTDLNECGTDKYRPPLDQACNYFPTCFDGMQNGDETGVDCGGSCAPCKELQEPALIGEEEGFPVLFFLLLIIILAALLALFVLYRERIYEGLAELGWVLARRRKKEILLSQAEKRLLFEELASLQQDVHDKVNLPAADIYERLANALRKFYSFVFDLPFEYLPEEFATAFKGEALSDDLRQLLWSFSKRLDLLESPSLPAQLNPVLFTSVLEETRLLVCMCAEYAISEIERELPERVIDERLSFTDEIRFRLLNAREALQFLRTDLARDEYANIIKAYENLSDEKKRALFPDIRRLYLEISYVQETAETMASHVETGLQASQT